MENPSQTSGVIIPSRCTLDEIIVAIRGRLSTWCWWINVQSGPFESLWLYTDDNEALVCQFWIDVPEFRDTSVSAWGRGFVPYLHNHVILDKWTYFYASSCDPNDFPRRAAQSERRLYSSTQFNPDFFQSLALTGDLFLMHVDGWWEIYTVNAKWQRRCLDHFSQAFIRTWNRAGEPPSHP